jgi:hypothetical protein
VLVSSARSHQGNQLLPLNPRVQLHHVTVLVMDASLQTLAFLPHHSSNHDQPKPPLGYDGFESPPQALSTPQSIHRIAHPRDHHTLHQTGLSTQAYGTSIGHEVAWSDRCPFVKSSHEQSLTNELTSIPLRKARGERQWKINCLSSRHVDLSRRSSLSRLLLTETPHRPNYAFAFTKIT